MRRYGTITVMGGGCYGGYYVRQLRRAQAAGAAHWERLVVVDRDPACAVFRAGASDVTATVADWDDHWDAMLGPAEGLDGRSEPPDMVVPSPLMPHLGARWLARRARHRWPARPVSVTPLARPLGTPWERAAPDASYGSHATWTCPINCIEPQRCPHTRADRDWSFVGTLAAWVEGARRAGEPVAGLVHQLCAHEVFGVGMFPSAVLPRGDALLAAAAADAPASILVASTSHCHGAVALVTVGAPMARP